MIIRCPSCEPYKLGDHEFTRYRVCRYHEHLLTRARDQGLSHRGKNDTPESLASTRED